MDREEALSIIRGVDEIEARSTARIRFFAAPAAIWAALSLGSLLLVLAVGPDRYPLPRLNQQSGIRWYWAFAIPAGLATSYFLHRRRPFRPRLPGLTWKTVLIGLAILFFTPLGAGLMLVMMTGFANDFAGPFPFVAIATCVVAWIARVPLLAIVSVVLFMFAVLSWSFASHAPIMLATGFTLAYAVVALVLHRRESRPA